MTPRRLSLGGNGGQWGGSTNPLSAYYSQSPQGQANKQALGQQTSLVKRFQQDNQVGPYRPGGPGEAAYSPETLGQDYFRQPSESLRPLPPPMAGSTNPQPAVMPGQTTLPATMTGSTNPTPAVMPGQTSIQGGQPSMTGGAQGGMSVSGGGQPMPSGGLNFGPTSSGVAGAEQAYQGALAGSLRLLNDGNNAARADLMQAGQGANNTLNPFYAPGAQSNDYQAALSGALGGDAQQSAMDRFMNSPGQQYLLNESERAIKRNAAATGGLGGGNVQRALQENAIGLAAQDFDNAFNRLGSISDRGARAGSQISGNAMATGAGLANLTNQNANTGAGMIYGTGNQIGAGRSRAGEMIANNIQGTSGNLANLMYGTGRDISNTIGGGSAQLIQALQSAGASDADIQMALANALAGNAQKGAATFAGVPSLGSTQQTDGNLDSVLTLLGGF